MSSEHTLPTDLETLQSCWKKHKKQIMMLEARLEHIAGLEPTAQNMAFAKNFARNALAKRRDTR